MRDAMHVMSDLQGLRASAERRVHEPTPFQDRLLVQKRSYCCVRSWISKTSRLESRREERLLASQEMKEVDCWT